MFVPSSDLHFNMSIGKNRCESTVDLAYPNEDANLLGPKAEKPSSTSWSKALLKPLAVLAIAFVVLGGYNLGSTHGASASLTSQYANIMITVLNPDGSPCTMCQVLCYDEDCAALGNHDFMVGGFTEGSGRAKLSYEKGTWDSFLAGANPDIFCATYYGAPRDQGGRTNTVLNAEGNVELTLQLQDGYNPYPLEWEENSIARKPQTKAYGSSRGWISPSLGVHMIAFGRIHDCSSTQLCFLMSLDNKYYLIYKLSLLSASVYTCCNCCIVVWWTQLPAAMQAPP